MNDWLKTSQAGIDHIKKFEGVRLRAYIPVKGDVPTIGYGHTLGVRLGDVISEDKAEQYLVQDLEWAEAVVIKYVTVDLQQNQFDALVSFIFNVGESQFSRSTLLRELNKRRYKNIPSQLNRWVYSGGIRYNGLVLRRKAEGDLFSEDYQLRGSAMPRMVDSIDEPVGIVQTIKESRKAKSAAGIMGGGVLQGSSGVLGNLSEAKGQAEGYLSLLKGFALDPYIIAAMAAVLIGGYIIYTQKKRQRTRKIVLNDIYIAQITHRDYIFVAIRYFS